MIATDLSARLAASVAITAFIPSTRMFFNKVLNADFVKNEDNYLSFHRVSESGEGICVEVNRWRINVFDKSALQLENICEAVKNEFKNSNKVMNGEHYFRCSLLSRTDGVVKLEDGFYWSKLTFDFSRVEE